MDDVWQVEHKLGNINEGREYYKKRNKEDSSLFLSSYRYQDWKILGLTNQEMCCT